MVRECANCGHENPEHIVYCGQCGESLREPHASSQSNGEEMSSVLTAPNGHLSSIQAQAPRRPIGLSQYTAATIVALAGVVLFVMALAFCVYYNELTIDHFTNPWDSRDSDDITLMNHLGKAYLYSMLIGEICVVLAILLLVHGSLMKQRFGMKPVCLAHLSLSRIRLLIILSLACVTTAFGLRLFFMEVQTDLDTEGWLRLQGLADDLRLVAWVCVSIVLFMVARRMQQGVKSSA